MKSRVIILSVLLFLTVQAGNIFAQQGDYGDDPETCRVQLSTYTEFFNQKNYEDAYPAWSWCFHNCPKATRNIYVQGATLMEYFINKETDLEKKEAYIDTLMMVYDKRMEYFGQEAVVKGRKAVSVLRYRADDVEGAYDLLKNSFELGRESSDYYVMEYYMSLAVVMLNNEKITLEEIAEIYMNIMDVLNQQLSNETNAAKTEKITETISKVEELFISTPAATCEMVTKLYTPKFEENPNDVELAKKILAMLDRGNSDDCKLSDLYMNTATLVYNNEKTANSAHSIAQAFLRRKEAANSEKYYNEAIDLETDPLKKANMYYELALLYFSMNNDYVKARTAARNAIANDPNHGRSYMLIARIYVAGSRNCGETALERKYVYCLAVDYLVKARNADPSIAQDVNEYIGRYSAQFPKREEIFWVNANEGDVVTVGCWINESTTIRVSD